MLQEEMPGRMMATLQMIADELDECSISYTLHLGSNSVCFDGMQIWSTLIIMNPHTLYLLPHNTPCPQQFSADCSFLFFGSAPENCHAPHLILSENAALFPVLNAIQAVFQRCASWDARLSQIIMAGGTLDDLCIAAIDYFQNPVYIHDSFFNVLAQPQWVQGMLPLSVNAGGKSSIPLDLINEFQTSHDYIDTLNYRTSQIWGVDQVCYGMRSLYINLLDNEKYRGRILVNEIQNPLRASDGYALEHLAKYVLLVLRRDVLLPHGRYLMFADVLKAYLTGETADMVEIRRCLDGIQWDFNDTYLCLRFYPHQQEAVHLQAASALCSAIDICLKSSFSFLDGETVCTIANLTHSGLDVDDCRMQLAPIIRDSLYFCGTSNAFSPFPYLKAAAREAHIALDMAHSSDNTLWYVPFQECALEFLLSSCEKLLPAEMFSAPELILLRKIDKEKGTEYFNTVKTYLYCRLDINETAKALFIHRTTLNYRLDKIFSIVPLQLDSFEKQLYLLFSAILLERGDQERDAHAALMPR